MRKVVRIWFCCFTFLLTLSGHLYAQLLSEQAQVSLLTYSPGHELYSAFGHSAIRVYDPSHNLDRVYNYGMFSFHEPGFYLKFAAGKLNYWLGAYDFQYLKKEQQLRNVTIHEQILNFNTEEKQAFFDFLNHNLQPENRFYLYDFFFDNCATRIYDAVQAVSGSALQLDTSSVSESSSFRNLVDAYLPYHPWADFGIDLALGARIDRAITPYEYLFLPDYLAASFQQSYIVRGNQKIPLVKERHVLFEGTQPSSMYLAYLQPQWIFYSILALWLLRALFTNPNKPTYWPDIILLSIYGVVGTVIFLLWIATDHQATKDNFNLLWLHPLHLVTVFLLLQKDKGIIAKLYLLVNGFLYLALLAFWEVIPQDIHPACLPLILLLAFRYFYNYTTIPKPSLKTRKKLKSQI